MKKRLLVLLGGLVAMLGGFALINQTMSNDNPTIAATDEAITGIDSTTNGLTFTTDADVGLAQATTRTATGMVGDLTALAPFALTGIMLLVAMILATGATNRRRRISQTNRTARQDADIGRSVSSRIPALASYFGISRRSEALYGNPAVATNSTVHSRTTINNDAIMPAKTAGLVKRIKDTLAGIWAPRPAMQV